MGCSHEDLFNEWIDPLKDGEIEDLGALVIEIGHELPVLSHGSSETLTTQARRERRGKNSRTVLRGNSPQQANAKSSSGILHIYPYKIA